ncbi:uncharacterized protein LACBIDRAFT_332135 [Laccaria bicolor S238N-H82]|uniref:Predicted protein n=1 Tax=Laccaria bicolor (strain S238N-H82 / ATCC MYA-4686) TaxID=486041 RepID=B0DRQ0_LACBS|nr:uncharacterized protein LACBIDRAFT_332135 [Laccaria bicolor S238N-H82]EDR02572.1 predicted protein [Laccaria bicolor S238N-H82]|eukprot:XP_001886616.1 predicted protein [Laccaria bicolor S238N-H82]
MQIHNLELGSIQWKVIRVNKYHPDSSLLSPLSKGKILKTMNQMKHNLKGLFRARDWLENGKKPLQTSLVPYCGALSIVERAQIANWFLCHISKNAETWLRHLPLAHVFTLYTAEHIKNEPKLKVLTKPEIINEAWRIQFTSIPSVLFDIDVEHEALENLETEMFEVSRAAGIASYYQWGLDAGHHQDWDPYARMEDLNNQDCPGDDDDLQSRSAVASTISVINAAWARGRVDEWGEAEEYGGQGELHDNMVLDGYLYGGFMKAISRCVPDLSPK